MKKFFTARTPECYTDSIVIMSWRRHLTRERVYSYMYIYTQTLPSIAIASLHNNLSSFKEQIQHYFKYTTNNPPSLLYITHIRHEQLTNNERSSVATILFTYSTNKLSKDEPSTLNNDGHGLSTTSCILRPPRKKKAYTDARVFSR